MSPVADLHPLATFYGDQAPIRDIEAISALETLNEISFDVVVSPT